MSKGSMLTLSRVQGATLPEQVATQLRSKILDGQLAPGTRLVELDLAGQMGLSQGPVREALQRLEQDGLVERRPRSGTFVTAVSFEEMREIFAVRTVVESCAILHTAQRITPHQLDELAELVQGMRAAARDGDIVTISQYDMEFHLRICRWSGQQTLLRVWLPLYTQVQRFIIQNHPTYFPDLVEIADTHQPILHALKQGVPALAVERIEEHLQPIWLRIEAGRPTRHAGTQDGDPRTP